MANLIIGGSGTNALAGGKTERKYFLNGVAYSRDQLQDLLLPGESVDDLIDFIDSGQQGYELPRDPNTGMTIPFEGIGPEPVPIPMSSLQGGGGNETLAGGTRSRYTLTSRDVEAINNTATRLGIRPQDLTAVMMYETIGTMNPDIVGGKGNNYQGLIQFGKNERRAYGYQQGMTFAEQVEGPVYRFLKDRGIEPGMDVGRLYRTINGGNPNARLTKNDGNGTIAQHIARIKADFLPQAENVLASIAVGPDVGAIMDVASRNAAPSAIGAPPTAAFGYAPDLGGLRPTPAQAAIEDFVSLPPGLPTYPPEWADATGFPIDESLTGLSAQDVLTGGPRMDPRRLSPGSGPIPADMGIMRSPADVLAEGPRSRPSGYWDRGPGGAPDAASVPSPGISPVRPAVGGPNDRRPQPPMPPSRAQGIPDPRSNPRRDPFGFPIDVNRPRISNPDGSFSTERTITFDASEVGLPSEIVTIPTIVLGQQWSDEDAMAAFAVGLNPPVQRGFSSYEEAEAAAEARTGSIAAARATNGMREGMFPTAYGEQPGPPPPLTDEDRQRILSDLNEFRQRNEPYSPMVAGMPDIPRPPFQSMIAGRPEFPGAIQPPSDIGEMPRSEPRVPASTALTPRLLDRLRQSQGIGPFAARPEFPGALPAAPNPYDDRSRQFDVPGPGTRMAEWRASVAEPAPIPEARTKDDAYTLPPVDFSLASDPAPILTAGPPPSPYGPIGNAVSPGNDRGAGRQAFVDANRTPVSVDYTKPAWSDLPDPTPPAPPNWREQFDISFSPGGPGMIADLTPPPGVPTPPPPSPARPPLEPYRQFEIAVGWMPQFAQPYAMPNASLPLPPPAARPDTLSQTLSTLPPQAIAQIEAKRQEAAQAGLVFVDIDLDSVLAGSKPMPQPVQMASNDPTQMPMGFAPSEFGYGDEQGLSIGAAPTQSANPSMADVGVGVAGGYGLAAPEPAQAPSRPQMAAPPPGVGNPSNTGIAAAGTPFGARQGSGGILGMLGVGKNPAQFYTQASGSSPYGDDQVTQWQRGQTNALGGSEGLQWQGSKGNTVTAVQNPWGSGYFTSYS